MISPYQSTLPTVDPDERICILCSKTGHKDNFVEVKFNVPYELTTFFCKNCYRNSKVTIP